MSDCNRTCCDPRPTALVQLSEPVNRFPDYVRYLVWQLKAGFPVTISSRSVTALNPKDLWHIDLTVVPTGVGFWVPWLPFAH